MTTTRPYRDALPVEVAVAELEKHRGTQFDPDVVDAFLRIPVEERLPTVDVAEEEEGASNKRGLPDGETTAGRQGV